MTNMQEQGTFAAAAAAGPFNPAETPMLSFDYRFTPDLKLNLGFIAQDHCYEITLTGETQPYSRVGIHLVGKVPEIKADGKWHHAELDLRDYPSLQNSKVEQVVFWNWENQGILKLALGNNPPGATADIGNLRVHRASAAKAPANTLHAEGVEPIWQIGKWNNSSGEFCHEAEAVEDYTFDQPLWRFSHALTEHYPTAKITFALKKGEVPPAGVLLLAASEFDRGGGGRVSVGIKLNNKQMKLAVFDERATHRHCIPLTGLQAGTNTLTLQRLEGGDWIAWDALELVPAMGTDPASLEATVEGDGTYEHEVADDYVAGQSGIFLERACTRLDPTINLRFYVDQSQLSRGKQLELNVRSRAAATNVPMGVQVRITINDRWLGETWFPAAGKELKLPVSSGNLRAGWNRITLRWVAGAEWIAWDRIALEAASSEKLALAVGGNNE